HHVDPTLLECMRFLQHAVRLADAGGEAEIDLEPAALGAFDQLQKVFGACATRGHGTGSRPLPWPRRPYNFRTGLPHDMARPPSDSCILQCTRPRRIANRNYGEITDGFTQF